MLGHQHRFEKAQLDLVCRGEKILFQITAHGCQMVVLVQRNHGIADAHNAAKGKRGQQNIGF